MATTGENQRVARVAHDFAAAIARRDTTALRNLMAPGFVHRSHGGDSSDAEAFVRAIEAIPGEIRFVRLGPLAVDLCKTGALVTGVQDAEVVIAGHTVKESRGFVDWFVQRAGEWRIQAAVDLPAPTNAD